MTESFPRVKVAVVQATPILFNREATVEKACRLTAEAAAQGAELILFPEAFIPAYPRGLSFGTVVGSRSLAGRRTWQRYWAHAVDVPGPATEALGAAARRGAAEVCNGKGLTSSSVVALNTCSASCFSCARMVAP